MTKRVATPTRSRTEPLVDQVDSPIHQTQTSLETPASEVRSAAAAESANSSGQTLLSTPAAAETSQTELLARIEALEDQQRELSARVRLVEKQKTGVSGALPWVAAVLFFAALAVTWQLVSALR